MGALLFALGLGLSPALAFAEATATEKAVAETLFVEGKNLMTEGRYADACPKLEQSQKIEGAIGTMLYLAECYEKTKRLASAWAMFREASSRARAEGQPDRAKMGDERARLLEPQLSKLTVSVAPENEMQGLRLMLDGHELPLSLMGTPVPVDGGEHTLSAEAPGYESFSIRIAVNDPAGAATVQVPALRPAAAPIEEPPPAPAAAASPPQKSSPEDSGVERGHTQEIVGLVLAGAGVVGAGVGVYFGLEANSADEEAEEICPREAPCNDQRGIDLTEDAQSKALTANILYGVGGAAVIAGVILYLTAEDSPERSSQVPRPGFAVGQARLYPDAVFTPSFSGVSLETQF